MRLLYAAVMSLFSLTLYAQSSLDIMYYNLLNFPGTTPERADTLRKIVQYVQPDLLVVNELSSEEGAELILNRALNQWGIAYYNRADFTDGPDTDNMLFYNTTKLGLASQYEIETELRLINEYILYTKPIVNDTIFLSVYSAHLKASQGQTEENLRLAEVTAFKDHLAEKNEIHNVIFGGDLNLYSSNERAYDAIISLHDILLFDPIFSPGSWHNNDTYAPIHTQSTRTYQFGGGSSGGMDDRFDMIFVSEDILNGSSRLNYIDESYHALGQDGNRFNLSLITPDNFSAPDSVISALYYMSDHLPVIMSVEVLDSASATHQQALVLEVDYQIINHTVHFSDLNDTVNFKIYDIMGRVVYSQESLNGNQSIYLPETVRNGIYIFRFEDLKINASFSRKHSL